MRIKTLEASNFKSLVEFRLELSKFNCIIGLNGSGKSTVLQFIDFLGQLVRGDIEGWLSERDWEPSDLKSKLVSKVGIQFRIEFINDEGMDIGHWHGNYLVAENRCFEEHLESTDSVLHALNDRVEIKDKASGHVVPHEIAFNYEGSILSALKEGLLPPSILNCKRFLMSFRSLDQLEPERLRMRTRSSSEKLGLGGKNLTSFLYSMSPEQRKELNANLCKMYSHLLGIDAIPLRTGWKQIEILETYPSIDPNALPFMLATEARHINDGTLRLTAILAALAADDQFLLFDEIENGVNPEIVEFMIEKLVNAHQQILVTTHSPMILNYLDDSTATKGVIYLYKTAQGNTKSIPFFSIPSLAEKLKVMGPGEAFVDTKLTELAREIDTMTGDL